MFLFKGNEIPPAIDSDRGHDVNHPASEVSFQCILYLFVSRRISELLLSLLLQEWTKRAKQIRCPAPLPEEPIIPRLAKMLVSAPYKAPEKKAKGVRSGPRRKGASDATSEDKTRSSVAEDDDDEEEERDSPPEGGRKNRAASTILEAEVPKKAKGPLVGSSAWDVESSPEQRPHTKPRAAS